MWNEEQRDAIWRFILNEVTHAELLQALAIRPETAGYEVRRELNEAISYKSMRHVEAALAAALLMDVESRSFLDNICMLLHEDWHISHEELIGRLQVLADPATIGAIKAAIQLKPKLYYLSYDDYGSYYKKCLWALQAIGTEEAVALIEECALSADEALRKQAVYRLSKIRAR